MNAVGATVRRYIARFVEDKRLPAVPTFDAPNSRDGGVIQDCGTGVFAFRAAAEL